MLFGGIPLGDVIAPVTGDVGSKAPQVLTTQTPDAITTTMVWQPDLQDSTLPVPKTFAPRGDSSLVINVAIVTQRTGGGGSTTQVTGELRDVDINIVGDSADKPAFVIVNIRRFAFVAKTGAKTDVDVDVGDVTFGSALAFMNALTPLLKTFGKGFGIGVTPERHHRRLLGADTVGHRRRLRDDEPDAGRERQPSVHRPPAQRPLRLLHA